MTEPREEMEAESRLHTPGSTATLCSVTLRDVSLDKSTDLSLLVEPAREVQHANKLARGPSYLISRCLPESMTQVMSGMVIPVSAMFVAMGAFSNGY